MKLDSSQDGGNQEESEEPKSSINEKPQVSEDRSKSRSPWRTGIHETPEEVQPEEHVELSQGQLRSSTRDRRPNLKYIEASYAEIKEPTTFEEASKSPEWRKAMEEEILALKQIRLGIWCQNLKVLNL